MTTIRNHYQNNQERNNMSNMLEKARKYETEKIAATDPQTKPLFHVSAPTGWIKIQMDFRFTMGRYIYSINIIHITGNGDQCTGDIALRAI